MKTKEELEKMHKAISKAISTYHKAIGNNLKESGKEHKLDNCDDDCGGVRCYIDGNVIVADKVRYNYEFDFVEVHVCEEEYEDADYWIDIAEFDYDEDYICANIVW